MIDMNRPVAPLRPFNSRSTSNRGQKIAATTSRDTESSLPGCIFNVSGVLASPLPRERNRDSDLIKNRDVAYLSRLSSRAYRVIIIYTPTSHPQGRADRLHSPPACVPTSAFFPFLEGGSVIFFHKSAGVISLRGRIPGRLNVSPEQTMRLRYG